MVQVKIGEKTSNEVPFVYITAESTQTIAGNGISGDVDGFNEKAQFNFGDMPGICLSPSGNIIISDVGNNKIKSMTPDGEVKTILTGLSKPTDVIYDKDGNLYIANCDAMAITRLDKNNQVSNVGIMDWPTALAYDETTDQIYGVLYAGGNIMKVVDKTATASSANKTWSRFLHPPPTTSHL